MNRWLWPFPIFCGSGKPLGDGIYWPTNAPAAGIDSSRSGGAAGNRGTDIS